MLLFQPFFVLGGGSTLNINETVNITLTQFGGNDSDLLGTTIIITNDDNGNTMYSGEWQGQQVTVNIPININYTISLGQVSNYVTPSSKSYRSYIFSERNEIFKYRKMGAYIESTDHNLYTTSQWTTAGKTANNIVVIDEKKTFKMALDYKQDWDFSPHHSVIDPAYVMTSVYPYNGTSGNYMEINDFPDDFDGKLYTKQLLNWSALADISGDRLQFWARDYVFPNGEVGAFLPSAGYVTIMFKYRDSINNCFTATGKEVPTWNTSSGEGAMFTSSYAGHPYGRHHFWGVRIVYNKDCYINYSYEGPYKCCFLVADYE